MLGLPIGTTPCVQRAARMRTSSFDWSADDGKPIFVYVFSPDTDEAPKGVVHIIHGMSEHAARYARVAEPLTALGFVVYAHDQRGHGRTAKTDDELGFFASSGGWDLAISDIRGLLAFSKKAHPGVPQAVIAHSMGSFMAQRIMALVGRDLSAVVLSATNGPPNLLARTGVYVAKAERARLGERGKSKILQGLSFDEFNKAFRPNRTAYDWISRDEAEVDKYVNDPRCGFPATTSLWVDLLEALPGLTKPETIAQVPKNLPIYVLAGGEDPVHERTKNLKPLLALYAKAGITDVTFRVYPGARHELFNETNRAEIIAEMTDWLSRKLKT